MRTSGAQVFAQIYLGAFALEELHSYEDAGPLGAGTAAL